MKEQIKDKLSSHPNFNSLKEDDLAISFYFMPSFISNSRIDFLISSNQLSLEIKLENSFQENVNIKVKNFREKILSLNAMNLRQWID